MGTEQMPGMKDEKIEELDTKMERYVDVRDKRMAQTKVETEARENLEEAMMKHKKESYRHSEGGLLAEITEPEEKPKVKVKKVNGDTED